MKSMFAVLALVLAATAASACGPGAKSQVVQSKTVVTTTKTVQTFPLPMPPGVVMSSPKVVYSPLATAKAFEYKPLAPVRRTPLFFGTMGGCSNGNCK